STAPEPPAHMSIVRGRSKRTNGANIVRTTSNPKSRSIVPPEDGLYRITEDLVIGIGGPSPSPSPSPPSTPAAAAAAAVSASSPSPPRSAPAPSAAFPPAPSPAAPPAVAAVAAVTPELATPTKPPLAESAEPTGADGLGAHSKYVCAICHNIMKRA